MNQTEVNKIRHFVNDQTMNKAVYDVLLAHFLEPNDRGNDVATLAASRIAIDLLVEGWKKLGKVRDDAQVETKDAKQIGL